VQTFSQLDIILAEILLVWFLIGIWNCMYRPGENRLRQYGRTVLLGLLCCAQSVTTLLHNHIGSTLVGSTIAVLIKSPFMMLGGIWINALRKNRSQNDLSPLERKRPPELTKELFQPPARMSERTETNPSAPAVEPMEIRPQSLRMPGP
jgi:hypothetical protein